MLITRRDVLWSYLGVIFNLGANLILLPLILHYLSGPEIGLWYVFVSIGTIVTLLDLGFSPTISRNVAYSWGGAKSLSDNDLLVNNDSFISPNKVLLLKVLVISKKIYLIITLFGLIGLVLFGTPYIIIVSNGENIDNLGLTWVIYLFSLLLSIYYSYYSSFLRGLGAIYEINLVLVISKTVVIVVSSLLLVFGFGILGVTVGFMCGVAVNRKLSNRIFKIKTKNIFDIKNRKVTFEKYELKKVFKSIWIKAWKDGLVTISTFMSTQVNTIIISLYLSLEVAGVYSLSLQLISIIISLSSVFYNAHQPKLQHLYVIRDFEMSKKIMGASLIIYTLLTTVGVLTLLFLGIPILNFIRPSFSIDISYILLLAMYYYALQLHTLFASYISNTNSVVYYKAFIVSSIFGVIVTILLLEFTELGIWSLILGPMFVQMLYNNWKWPLYVNTMVKTSFKELLKHGLDYLIKLVLSIKRGSFH
ncbi:MAG: O-unit flippase-like protein [Acholeplasmataceae bacterium]|jgi:O-antigen/teichoic acid export membrane protein|nr:O-unit flippase-like protein [Acholeplasmataceae bacterium]